MSQEINPQYLTLLLVSLAALAYTLYRFFHRWREARFLRDTPQARVRSAAQGYVKLTGVARMPGGPPMRAPLSDRACVWWSYYVEERVSSFGRNRWQRTDSGTSDKPFLVCDPDSECLLDPSDAEIEPSETNVWVGSGEACHPGNRPPSGSLYVAISHAGIASGSRARESLIFENANVTVMGALRTDDGGASNALADETAALLNEWKRDQPALLARFDTDHDGHLNTDEWEAARAAAATQVDHDRLHQAPAQRVRTLGKPADGQPFIIAALSAEILARRERLRALAALALVGISLAVCCFSITHLHSS